MEELNTRELRERLTYDEAENLALQAIHDSDGRGMVGRGRNHLHQRVARAILDAHRAALLSYAEAREEAERANAEIEEAFDAAAKARDEAGFLGTPADCINYLDAECRALTAQLQAVETRAQQAEAFVRLVGRLTMTGDDGWTPPDDPDDAQAALDSLITKARDLMAAMPARQARASHG